MPTRLTAAPACPTPRSLRPITTFGLGHCRPAPGTWGSLPPVALAAGLLVAGLGPAAAPWAWYCTLGAVVVIFSLACIIQGDAAEAVFGRKDPSQAVADETAGMALALIAVPPGAFASTERAALWLGAAFVAFRLADIIKPPPCRGLQRLAGGWGILIDDLIAAIYAGVAVHVAARLLIPG